MLFAVIITYRRDRIKNVYLKIIKYNVGKFSHVIMS